MTIKRGLQVVYGISAVLALAAMVVAGLANVNLRKLIETEPLRLQSYWLADELRQSSDDLTRFARTYAATGDPKYETYYREVLAVRNGERPRPDHYERVYWDLLAGTGIPPRPPARTVSLQQLMRETGFTEAEFAKLRESQAASDVLVKTEEIAMHAMKGEFDDGTGAFARRGPPDQALALRILHDAEYHRQKAGIMKPLDDVLGMLDRRTSHALGLRTRRSALFWRLIQVIATVFLALLAVAYPLVRRRVFAPLEALQQQTRMVAADLNGVAAVAARIAEGDLRQQFTTASVPLQSARRDEVGDLTRLHDEMIVHLRNTVAAIATMTTELNRTNQALSAENAERQRAEARAADAQHRIRDAHRELLAIIDTVPSGLVILNQDGSVRLQNRAAEYLLGTAPADPGERRRYWDSFSVRDRGGRPVALRDLAPVRALTGQEVVSEELDVQAPDGRSTTILVGAVPIRDESGQPKGAVAGFQDISRLRELDRMKDEFVAIVSHEMRTPLTAILGSMQLLLAADAVADPENRELLEVGLKSCERLIRIVNDMLDISKIEAGELRLHLVRLDVAELVRHAVDSVEGVAGEAGVTLHRDVDPALPAVRGDADRLTQALVNLLSNAIKFAPRGSTVTVSARETAGAVAMSVADNGPGIAAQDLSRLFRKFQQLEGPNTHRSGGTGLGLAITKAIVEQHRGTIEVESTVGRGTAFTFTVPRWADESLSQGPPAPAAAVLPAGRVEPVPEGPVQATVLLAEDDDELRSVMARGLEAHGFQVLEAADGAGALAVVAHGSVDVLVLDLHLPDVHGHDVIRALRTNPATAQLPIIVLSGSVGARQSLESLILGANAFLAKPAAPDALAREVVRLLAAVPSDAG